MKQTAKIITLFFLIFMHSQGLFSQNNVSLRMINFTYHPTNKQSTALYNYMFDEQGKLTFEPGVILSYESFGDELTSIVFTQAAFRDVAKHWAGYTQLLVRRKVGQVYKHYFYIGIGPIIHYRQSWTNMILYRDEVFYTLSDNQQLQYKMGWFSAEIEYKYYLSKKLDITFVLNHLKPESIGITVGLKYWINRKAPKKCRTCPSFKK